MKYLLSVLFSFIIISSSFSQTEKVLSQLPYESILDTILKYRYTNFDKSLVAAKAYSLKGSRQNEKDKEWLGMESIAFSYNRFRMYKEANDQGEKMLEFAKDNKLTDLELRSLAFLGDLQVVATTGENALKYYDRLLKLAEAYNNERYKLIALNKIAEIYSMVGNEREAISIRKKSLSYYKDKPVDSAMTQKIKNSTLVYVYDLLGNSHLKLGQKDSAKLYSRYIKEFKKEELDSCYDIYYYSLDAEIAYYDKNWNEARKKYEQAYSICPSEYALYGLNRAYDFGKIEVDAKNYYEAIRILQQGLDDYQVSSAEEGFMDNYYEKLAIAYKNTGDFERASYYYEKYLTTQNEFNKLKEGAKKKFLENERKAFKEEFDLLVADKDKKQSYLTYILLGSSVIILILLFYLLKFYRNKKANEAKFEALLAKIKTATKPEEIIDTKDEVLEEKNTSDVSEEVTQQILDGLKKIEEKEYFLKKECNSYNVAKKVGTNTTYLSKVINSHFGKNFNTYINDLRINYAIVRIKNDVIFRSYSIQSIAEEIGYKSADSFTKYFKQDTGLNPSFYIKNIKDIA